MNYIAIIGRSQFNDLYRYGHIYVHNSVPFEGNLLNYANDKTFFQCLTQYMNTYEYSTEYLELHFSRVPFSGTTVEVFIKDVTGVFALNKDAYASLSASLDSRINLQVSCWTEFYNKLSRKQSIRQSKAGMYNCFEIFGIKEDDRAYVKQTLTDGFIEDLFDGLYSKNRPSGEKPVWTYLVRYERHDPYWNDERGFFSDAIHAFENYLNKAEINYEIADEVPLGDIVANSNKDYEQILINVLNAEHAKYELPGCSYLTVASLFLYIKSYFKDGGMTMSKMNSIRTSCDNFYILYKSDFALAIGLLGIVLSQESTYSCYYEIRNLSIFNKQSNSSSEDCCKKISVVDPKTNNEMTKEETESLLSSLYQKIDSLEQEKLDVTFKESSMETMNPSESNNIEANELTESYDLTKENDNYVASSINEEPPLDNPCENSLVESHKNEEQDSYTPVEMKKLSKDRKKFDNRSKTSKWAHSKSEEEEYRSKGFECIDFFEKNQLFNN